MQDKCFDFFKQHEDSNPDWSFPFHDKEDAKYDKGVDNKQHFFKDQIHKLTVQKRRTGNREFIVQQSDLKEINSKYESSLAQSKSVLKSMADTISVMRVYGKCFIQSIQPGEKTGEYHELNNRFTHKLFPYLTGKLPIFQSIDEENPISKDTYPVLMDSRNNFMTKTKPNTDNIIEFISNNLNGKGIVIAAGGLHLKDLLRLIKILRALNNKLPIQIMHIGELKKAKIDYIRSAATAPPEQIFKLSNSEHSSYLPELNLLERYREFGSEFPKQEIQIVNLAKTIDHSKIRAFTGYSTRLLALLFSSFKEVVLLDADTVPLVPIEQFFQSKQYQSSGTYFFRDRSLRDYNDFIETNYFSTLFPTNEKSIETLFDIPRITSKTLDNVYMTGWRHFQEAGVVVINKKQHFLGILMTLPLVMWKEPVNSSIWGDKEMYWLGLAMAGDENYEFNPLAAAAVGSVTNDPSRKLYTNTPANEVCSTHPGHVDDQGRLLWINSGFSYCKKNGYFKDKNNYPFKNFDITELSELYSAPLRIRAAIVPPDLPNFRKPGSPTNPKVENNFRKSWEWRPKDIDEINENIKNGDVRYDFISHWGPQKGWIKSDICNGYYYCAYDSVASYSASEKYDKGKLFEFGKEEVKLYDYLSKIWHTGGNRKVYTDG
ncbi:uncharacterized protein J8A68_005704 [[Candida] subhashii]|uniref:Alpha-1,3-mannosyltransferase n=1 Tax=[Candida] subhashii TaxID=561895 RepID=A0A8J5QFI2_9ASCO|nr:uncharacterized protein J8A68_005704 [[Candida] subhashii]KAG7660742.1 hypothetical protein J8A68_005704 [[Candida] subhashii]